MPASGSSCSSLRPLPTPEKLPPAPRQTTTTNEEIVEEVREEVVEQIVEEIMQQVVRQEVRQEVVEVARKVREVMEEVMGHCWRSSSSR